MNDDDDKNPFAENKVSEDGKILALMMNNPHPLNIK